MLQYQLLLGARRYQSISPAHTTLGSKPTAAAMMGQTDGRTADGYIDPAPHYYAGSAHKRPL